MIDFDLSKKKAFDFLQTTNSVCELSLTEKEVVSLQKYGHVWGVNAEIFDSAGQAQNIKLYVALNDDFPISLPRIYLSNEDRIKIEYIPHVDPCGYICLYNEDTIDIDIDNPALIVKTCLNRALKIIEDGLTQKNIIDFNEEFIAYWEQKYHPKDVIDAGLNMLIKAPEKNGDLIPFLSLTKSYSGYSIVLHNEDGAFLSFKNYLKGRGYEPEESQAYYIGNLTGLKPPFDLKGKDLCSLIKDKLGSKMNKFKSLLNATSNFLLVVFSITIEDKLLYFGWQINVLKKIKNGYRKGKMSHWEKLNNLQGMDYIPRFKFDLYTEEALVRRTDGTAINNEYKVVISGLGSIGSNILNPVSAFGLRKLALFDPEILTIANVNRHLLGFEYVNHYKVDGIKDYLTQKSPFLQIDVFKESITKKLKNEIGYFNEFDLLLFAVGKSAVEKYVFELLRNNILSKPVFFIWVEPYLFGGHCLYLNPGGNILFDDLYNDGLYKFNIIDSSEYKNPIKRILLKEAGCQSSFIPYGQQSIILFISNIAGEILKLLKKRPNTNLRFTWKNPLIAENDMGLNLSVFGNNLKSEKLEIAEL